MLAPDKPSLINASAARRSRTAGYAAARPHLFRDDDGRPAATTGDRRNPAVRRLRDRRRLHRPVDGIASGRARLRRDRAGSRTGGRRRIRPQQRLRAAGLCRRDRRAMCAGRCRPRGAPVAPVAGRRGARQGAGHPPCDRLRSEKRRADGSRLARGCRGARHAGDIDARLRLRARAPALAARSARDRQLTQLLRRPARRRGPASSPARLRPRISPAPPWRRALRSSRTVRCCGSNPARGRKL